MFKAIVIVDYNNIFTSDLYSVESIEASLTSVVENILSTYSDVNNIITRVYAGLYQEGELTKRGSEIISKLGQINPFPNVYYGRLIYGEIQFVDQIYGVDYSWRNTYREKPGPRLIVNKSIQRIKCASNKEKCPVEILARFTKSAQRVCSTPECNIQNGKIFTQYGQKMIDTMMTCDILTYAEDIDTKCIYVLTDDVDLYPSIVLCRRKHPTVDINVGTRNNMHVEESNELKNIFNIKTFLLT